LAHIGEALLLNTNCKSMVIPREGWILWIWKNLR